MVEHPIDKAKTAVLAMDFQRMMVEGNAMVRERKTMETVRRVLEAARRARILVIHVVIQFRPGGPEISDGNKLFGTIKARGMLTIGSPEAAIHEALGPLPGELVVNRPRVNAFYNSELESILRAKGVDTVLLMGISTNFVVDGTARHAADADYRVIVVADGCAGGQVEDHDASLRILSRLVEVATAEEVIAAMA